jgi:hypothetical protein
MKHRVVLIVLSVLSAVAAGLAGSRSARADGPNRVGLVVRFGDGSHVTRCVEFGESEISGYDVLARSGLSVVADFSMGGAAICKIESDGCPAGSCLTCQKPSYWSYWYKEGGGGWAYSGAGSSLRKASDGDVEGWSWTGTEAQSPPDISFDDICSAAPPGEPEDTETPTAEPSEHDPVVWFRLENNPVEAGQCTNVAWDTVYVTEAYFDGERVDLIGSREVCPAESTEYQLRVVTDEGEETHKLVLGVSGSQPAPTATSPPPSPTVAPATATPSPAAPTTTPTVVSASEESPLPSPTPKEAASSQPPTPTASPVPASASPMAAPVNVSAGADEASTYTSPVVYVGFALIVVALGGMAAVTLLRRR